MKTLFAMLLFFGLATPGSATAQELLDWCQPPDTTVVFANGMFTDNESAQDTADRLERMIRDNGMTPARGNLETELAYNQNENWFEQILEVIHQRQLDAFAGFWRWIRDGVFPLPESIENELKRLQDPVADEDLLDHLKMYRSLTTYGTNRVVILAHSQGNFYTNHAYDLIHEGYIDHKGDEVPALPKGQIGVVAVAAPVGRISGDFGYTTLTSDDVINGVRLAYPLTLPGNVALSTFQKPEAATFHHDLLNAYLNWKEPKEKILAQLENQLKKLKATPIDHPEVIEIVAEWQDPDADFKLFVEPPEGAEGRFERNEAGQTKERYLADCAGIRAGDYKVFVSYPDGPSDEQQVEVNLYGGGAFGGSIVTYPSGPSDTPVELCILRVTEGAQGTFDFQVVDP